MANSGQCIHLATGNAHKVREMQALADAMPPPFGPIQFVPASAMPAVAEDSGSFAGNARQKAAALQAVLPPGAWILADDSGLCVDALGGAPGVESAYYAGRPSDSAANLRKLTEDMRRVAAGHRGAYFICVLVLLGGPAAADCIVEGRCPGTLRLEPAGGQGFGYDPLFEPAGFTRTMAELAPGEKNRISHRALAFARLCQWLQETKSGGR